MALEIEDINEQRLEVARRAFDAFNFDEKNISYGIKKVETWDIEGNTYTLSIPSVVNENKKNDKNDNVILYVDFKDNSFEVENVEAWLESASRKVGFMPDSFYEIEKEKNLEMNKRLNLETINNPIVKKKTGFPKEFKF